MSNVRVSKLKAWLPYVLVVGFAIGCLIALQADIARLPLRQLMHAWDALAVAGALSLGNYALRSLRWRAYLARLGYPVPVGVSAAIFVSGFAFTLSPGKIGEMVRARYYAPLGVPLNAIAAAFVVERVMDLLAMVVLACLALATLGHLQPVLWVVFAGVVAALVGCVFWPQLAAWVGAHWQLPIAPRLARVVATVARTFGNARALLHPRVLAMGFILALIAWGAEGIGFGILASVFEPQRLDPLEATGIYAAAVIVGGLSFLPGGLGTTEAAMTALLVARGFPLSEAMLVTLLCRLLTLWFAVLLGWIAVFGLRPMQESVPRWQ